MPKFTLDAEIVEQKKLIDKVFKMTVHCPQIAEVAEPGSFVQLRLLNGDIMLRRPVGIADADKVKGTLSFIYRVVGRGTADFAALSAGDTINVLGPLGHGFTLDVKKPLLVGGGMGLSPLLFYARRMGACAEALMGGKNASELFWTEMYEKYVSKVHITTDDGSLGTKGFTTTLLPELLKNGGYDAVIVCGPEIMMRGVSKIAKEYNVPCQVSLEKRMACGLGACLSCSIDTTDGKRKKVCKDGPVFWAQEVFA